MKIIHLRLFGRAACKPVASDQRRNELTVRTAEFINCQSCIELVARNWPKVAARLSITE